MDYPLQELELLLERERTAKNICAELNNFMDLKPTLTTVINHIKTLTDCEAVSLRLEDERDFPYYTYNGFSESFIKKENSLCSKNTDGKKSPSPNGEGFLLDCMCGSVISGNTDPTLPYFTKNGSFWSNNTSVELVSNLGKKRKGKIENYCNSCGYESVALIPIKARGETVGLIQLNDHKPDMFKIDLIEYLEMIAEQVGVAVQNSLTYIKQITTDNLTNTLNRSGLLNAISYLVPFSKRNRANIGLMMIDVDHFKEINDTYGHQKGDQILQKVASTIKSSIRQSDIFGRYGGDEFMLFLSSINKKELPSLAEKLRTCVEEETKKDIPTTISIGIANGVVKVDNEKEVNLLIKKADESLYEAKKQGRNTFCLTSLKQP